MGEIRVLETAIATPNPDTYGEDGVVDLRVGHCGKIVVEMQCLLIFLGFEIKDEDAVVGSSGNYDDSTAFAVSQFQKAAGLPITGKIDFPTRKALLQAYIARKAAADKAIAEQKAKDEARKALSNEIEAAVKGGDIEKAKGLYLTTLTAAINAPEAFDAKFGLSDQLLVKAYKEYKALLGKTVENVNGLGQAKKEEAPPEAELQAEKKEMIAFFVGLMSDERLTLFQTAKAERKLFWPFVDNENDWDRPSSKFLFSTVEAEIEKRKKAKFRLVKAEEQTPAEAPKAPPAASSSGATAAVVGGLFFLVVFAMFRDRVNKQKSTPPTLQGYGSPLPPLDEDEEEEEDEE